MAEPPEIPATVCAFDRSVGRHVFGQDAIGYEAGRLGYPGDLYDRIFERAGCPRECRIFEVGAGTGLATRHILERDPAALAAIEPDPKLAAHLAARFGGRIQVIGRRFEENRLPAGHFDAGLAAACFHWLDPKRAIGEARRLLRSGGCWAMWWNVYRAAGVGDAFADETVELFRGLPLPPSEGPNGHIGLDRGDQEGLLLDSGLVDVDFHLFRRERALDAAEMRKLYASYSFVRRLPPDKRERLLDSICALVDRQFGGSAPNVVLTPLYLATAP